MLDRLAGQGGRRHEAGCDPAPGQRPAPGEEGGITKLNGEVRWNPKLNAWLSFCVSPSSAFYTAENRPTFLKGVKAFAKLVEALGIDSDAISGRSFSKPESVKRKVSGQSFNPLRKIDQSDAGKLRRVSNAMTELYRRERQPVFIDDAQHWAEANGIEFESEKTWNRLFLLTDGHGNRIWMYANKQVRTEKPPNGFVMTWMLNEMT